MYAETVFILCLVAATLRTWGGFVYLFVDALHPEICSYAFQIQIWTEPHQHLPNIILPLY